MSTILDHNKVPVQELGDQASNLGGAGTGFDMFPELMGVVGVHLSNAPDMALSGGDVGGPSADLSSLVLGRKPVGLNNG